MNRVTLLLIFSLLLYTRYKNSLDLMNLMKVSLLNFSFFALVVELKTSEASLLDIVTGRTAVIVTIIVIIIIVIIIIVIIIIVIIIIINIILIIIIAIITIIITIVITIIIV